MVGVESVVCILGDGNQGVEGGGGLGLVGVWGGDHGVRE